MNKSCEQELSCEQMSSNVTSMSAVSWSGGSVRKTEDKAQLRPAAAGALPELGNIFLQCSTNGNQEGTLNY